jgi:hypothetical protein
MALLLLLLPLLLDSLLPELLEVLLRDWLLLAAEPGGFPSVASSRFCARDSAMLRRASPLLAAKRSNSSGGQDTPAAHMPHRSSTACHSLL